MGTLLEDRVLNNSTDFSAAGSVAVVAIDVVEVIVGLTSSHS